MNDIYQFTVPIFIKHLGGLRKILDKAEAFTKEGKITEEALLEDRMWADMFPLRQQVQIACDNAKGAGARLSGAEMPKYEDNEKTFAELRARVDKTVEFLKTVKEESFKDVANVKATFPYFPGQYIPGYDYAREYALPNFIFHLVTAYDIIRKNGVSIGKADYMNGMTLKDL